MTAKSLPKSRTTGPVRPRPSPRRSWPVAYIFGRFPMVSETFLVREMNALADGGLRILPMAMRPGEEPVHREARRWLRHVIVRPPIDAAMASAAAAWCASRVPAGWLSALRLAAALAWRYPSRTREIATGLVSAAYFAAAARGQIRHVHATFASYPATAGLLLAELLGTSFSFAGHARDLFTREASFLEVKLREAEFAVVCSELARQHLFKVASATVRERIFLVRHGLKLGEYTREFRPANPRPVIISAGRLVPKKGFRHLLEAAALLMRLGINFELHIYGEGPQEEYLREVIRGLQIENFVRLHGFVPHEELKVALQHADLFVLASVRAPDEDNEGVPNVLVEALALEVPVVATRTGGIPELIKHEVTGLLAEPGDATDLATNIERLLTDQRLRSAVTAAGRVKVQEEYDLDRNAAVLYRIFQRYMR